MAEKTWEDIYLEYINRSYNWADFEKLANEKPCIKSQVIAKYKQLKAAANLNDAGKRVLERFDENNINNVRDAANYVWVNKQYDAILRNCAAKEATRLKQQAAANQTQKDTENADFSQNVGPTPFDRRLDRIEIQMNNKQLYAQNIVPFSTEFAEVATSGYLIGKKAVEDIKDSELKEKARKARETQYQQMLADNFYKGVPALQNNYALIRLYGSDGGSKLVNQKNKRKWYEVDSSPEQPYNFASTPTTSALISWGNGDPYGRTPYAFTDFVFSKYWNKIPNNRLITLRRYAAPILDNLKFPGMHGGTDPGTSKSDTASQKPDQGSTMTEATPFPPMASAVTFFGSETGNSLNNILKFTTGVLWDDAQASIWEVQTDSVPDNKSGAGALYSGLANFAEMLNVAGGHFDRELIMNSGQLPPDPYSEGPYENRIQGPINRIDSVKKRKPGLAFEWGGLNLVFEYVARPVGGINPKAVLLDIMSNFLIIGSASAVFFGGAHRFMANPAKYPFIGGDEGIEKWYRGDPIGWGLTAIKQFSGEKGTGNAAASNILESAKGFIDQLLSGDKGSLFGSITSLLSPGSATGNIVNNEIAKKTAGQIPYLRGLKAILTGEPVGEWHVTIGNPLNPIAMIGNLICEGIDVEFNEELGPDDFPTEMKITVKLKHAMARDRDAIESIFNRGMGRIYTLPESFLGTADGQTGIDQYTQENTQVGTMPNRRMGILYHEGLDSGYIPASQIQGSQNQMHGAVSVWNRGAFNIGISENSNVQVATTEIFRTAYRSADWIAQRAQL